MRFLIYGYYGYQNTGDEAMLEVIVNKLKALYNNCEIVVTSADPQDTEQKFGVIAPLARIIHKPSFSVEIV